MAIRSKKGKGLYATYKSNNQVFHNKVRKLERHIKKYPDDKEAKKTLEKVKKNGYNGRSKPLVPGSNPTTPKPRCLLSPGFEYPKTAGEQLSELLGISIPIQKSKRSKPKIIHKSKKI